MIHSYTENNTSTQSQVALHLMVNQLSISTMPSAVRRQNVVVNDVPSTLYFHGNEQKLAAVLGSLLTTIIGHSQNSQLRISAKSYGNVIVLHLRENSRLNSPSFATSLVRVQELADRIGGSVSVTSYRNKVTTVAFSFLSIPVAA